MSQQMGEVSNSPPTGGIQMWHRRASPQGWTRAEAILQTPSKGPNQTNKKQQQKHLQTLNRTWSNPGLGGWGMGGWGMCAHAHVFIFGAEFTGSSILAETLNCNNNLLFEHNNEQWVWTEYFLFTNRLMSNMILCTNKSYAASTLQYNFRIELLTHFRQRHASVKCYPNPKGTKTASESSSTEKRSIMHHNPWKFILPLKRTKEFLNFHLI